MWARASTIIFKRVEWRGRVKQWKAKNLPCYSETRRQVRQGCLIAEILESRICSCCQLLALTWTPDGYHPLIVSLLFNAAYQTVLIAKQCLHRLPVTFHKKSQHTVSLRCRAHVLIKYVISLLGITAGKTREYQEHSFFSHSRRRTTICSSCFLFLFAFEH